MARCEVRIARVPEQLQDRPGGAESEKAMNEQSIEAVAPSNFDQAIGTIVLAFSADPVARWFYPDPLVYLTQLPHFVRAFAGKAFEYNSAYQID